MSHNFNVFCRISPNLLEGKFPHLIDNAVKLSSTKISIIEPKYKEYEFDSIFDPKSTQKDLFDELSGNIVNDLFEGKDCTIIAHGQKNTGKTHTILGDLKHSENRGLFSRFLEAIVEMKELSNKRIGISVSAFEISCGKIVDLLKINRNEKLIDAENKIDHNETVVDMEVTNSNEIGKFLKTFYKTIASTRTKVIDSVNQGHTLFKINLDQEKENSTASFRSTLTLADLVGSENLSKSRRPNLSNFNRNEIKKSLCSLETVMYAIGNRNPHIPFRDNILTRCLQQGLTNDQRTKFILCLSPSTINAMETISTLQFYQKIIGKKSKSSKDISNMNLTQSTVNICCKTSALRYVYND